ncbi:septum formation initiator family protein [Zhouia sp. PK063]|uniref:septum formation initiator family protein n=1 Tax=Zhouia sp. PK063 TaxID=3373602 RepID=UPI0037A89010
MGLKEITKSKWFKYFGNIYVLIITVFAIWMIFFDTNSYLVHLEIERDIEKLRKKEKELEQKITKDKETLKKLKNPEELEKYAREKYYLKKKNEEIYLIEYEDSIKTKQDE